MRRSPASGIRRVLRIGVVQRELDDELAFHFESTVEELMESGKTRAAAEEEARRRFGDERLWRRELLRLDRSAASWARWGARLEIARQTVGHAFRRMRRAPSVLQKLPVTSCASITRAASPRPSVSSRFAYAATDEKERAPARSR